MKLEFRQATLDEILDLRVAVLRRGPVTQHLSFPGDKLQSTQHFGAFVNGVNVCCLTIMVSEFDAKPAFQLRGMATHPDYQRQKFGARLLTTLEAALQPRPAILWCNARAEAVGFYQQQDWKIVSEQFDIAAVGPHFKMSKLIV